MTKPFTTMTFNIGNGLVTIDRLRDWLEQSGTDLVALQEVSDQQANAIGEEFGDTLPYRIVRGGHYTGRAILSRFPLVEHEWIPSDPDRPDLRVVADVDGQPVTIVNAHPSPPRPSRSGWIFDDRSRRQIQQAAQAALDAQPAILLGDFNMTARHEAYRWMREVGLEDAWATTGTPSGRTLPVRMGQTTSMQRRLKWVPMRPLARVDYIWTTEGVKVEDAWVGDDLGSDHLPVLARISPVTEQK